MRIEKIIPVPGLSGFYFDDQLAIKMGAVGNGATYFDQPLTPGFSAVRQSGESRALSYPNRRRYCLRHCSAHSIQARTVGSTFLAKDLSLLKGFFRSSDRARDYNLEKPKR